MITDQPDTRETRSRRLQRLGVVFFVLALLATLCGAYHLIENWQGKKKWEVYKRQLVAQGVKLDLASFIPPPIPDEDNFAASPFFAEVLPGPLPTNWNRWPKLINGLRPQTNAEKRNERHLTDLVAYQVALRAYNRQDTNSVSGNRAEAAKELIAAMKIYEPPRQELIAASARPRARYNIKYDLDNPWGILVPHLGVIKQVCQDLSFKACAELALRNNEQAMEDVRLMARLTHSLDTELFLITYMVKVACLQLLVQPIWEGLADGQWSVAQLEELQGIMSEFNLVGDLVVPLGMEQAAGVLTGDILLKHKKKAELFNALFNGGTRSPFASLSVSMVPRGWFYLEQYNCARLFQQFIWPGFDPTNRIIEPQVSDQNAAKLNKLLTETKHPIFNHLFFATQLLPAVDKAQRRAAQAQTAAHEVTIACALERYRRKHGDYPGHLDALTPEFMKVVPHDVIGGKPMHYKAGKPFVLYSVGWDTKDNGGASGRMLWDDRGDWVWTYPQ